jgi:hypothetical protein
LGKLCVLVLIEIKKNTYGKRKQVFDNGNKIGLDFEHVNLSLAVGIVGNIM